MRMMISICFVILCWQTCLSSYHEPFRWQSPEKPIQSTRKWFIFFAIVNAHTTPCHVICHATPFTFQFTQFVIYSNRKLNIVLLLFISFDNMWPKRWLCGAIHDHAACFQQSMAISIWYDSIVKARNRAKRNAWMNRMKIECSRVHIINDENLRNYVKSMTIRNRIQQKREKKKLRTNKQI